jgi:L-lactate dehydrogenase complex protein LldG
MNLEAFLSRVREAAHQGRAYRVHVRGDLPADVGYVGAGPDKLERLAAEIIGVGGQAHLVPDLAAAREKLRELILAHSAQTALCWEHPLLDRLGLNELLAELNVRLLSQRSLSTLPPAEQREPALAAQIGITSTTWAIAETGSLAVASGPGTERMASLLPPVHVAIVEESQVLADLFDLFARLEADGLDRLPSNLVLITGPSKTGDIELRLTTGVHGPGIWHVIIVGQQLRSQSSSASALR